MTDKERELKKKYIEYVRECQHNKEVPEPWGIWCFLGAKREDLLPFAHARITDNKKLIDHENQFVGGNSKGLVLSNGKRIEPQRISPEYEANAKAVKELRESLKTYSGSSEMASDLLFAMKKDADKEDKNFRVKAEEELKKIIGEDPEYYHEPVYLTESGRPKWSKWRYFINRISGGYLCKQVGDIE